MSFAQSFNQGARKIHGPENNSADSRGDHCAGYRLVRHPDSNNGDLANRDAASGDNADDAPGSVSQLAF
jgi:hypothetical protein